MHAARARHQRRAESRLRALTAQPSHIIHSLTVVLNPVNNRGSGRRCHLRVRRALTSLMARTALLHLIRFLLLPSSPTLSSSLTPQLSLTFILVAATSRAMASTALRRRWRCRRWRCGGDPRQRQRGKWQCKPHSTHHLLTRTIALLVLGKKRRWRRGRRCGGVELRGRRREGANHTYSGPPRGKQRRHTHPSRLPTASPIPHPHRRKRGRLTCRWRGGPSMRRRWRRRALVTLHPRQLFGCACCLVARFIMSSG